jgi:hypothetical protein
MKPITDARHDCDDAGRTVERTDMTVERIVARIRWLDAMLTDLQRDMTAAAVNPGDPGSSEIFRKH